MAVSPSTKVWFEVWARRPRSAGLGLLCAWLLGSGVAVGKAPDPPQAVDKGEPGRPRPTTGRPGEPSPAQYPKLTTAFPGGTYPTDPSQFPTLGSPPPRLPETTAPAIQVPTGAVAATSQIVARGPLVLVPARERGVVVVDGRRGSIVRTLSLPGVGGPTAGVALIDDDVVFAQGRHLLRLRLDGRPRWLREVGGEALVAPAFHRRGEGDTERVVAVVRRDAASAPSLVILDGRGGALVGSLELPEGCGPLFRLDGERALLDCSMTGERTAGTLKVDLRSGQRAESDAPGMGAAVDLAGGLTRTGAATPYTLANLDGGGLWQRLEVVDGMLRIADTGSRATVRSSLPRGDLFASGALPRRLDSPAASWSRRTPRDRERWLSAGTPERRGADLVVDEAATFGPGSLHGLLRAELPRGGCAAPVEARLTLAGGSLGEELVTCGHGSQRRRFATSEGRLIEEVAGRWGVVDETLEPIWQLRCDGDDLLVETQGATYRSRGPVAIVSPPIAAGLALLILGLLVLPLVYRRHRARRLAAVEHEAAAEAVRFRFQADVPLVDPTRASRDQRAVVEALRAFVDNEDTVPPVTLAIYGPWGSGKTSLMGMLRHELDRTGRYVTVWFNAWRFQKEEQLAAALMQTIVDEFRRQAGLWVRLRAVGVRLLRLERRQLVIGLLSLALVLIAWRYLPAQTLDAADALLHDEGQSHAQRDDALMSLAMGLLRTLGLAQAAVIVGWYPLLRPFLKLFSAEPAERLAADEATKRLRFLHEFSRELELVVGALPSPQRLVVFVDDLDRCPPDRVVDVLEALNMLTEARQCFFVMGLDAEAVRRAIELRYRELVEKMNQEPGGQEGHRFGARYLEKIVTVGVHVPEVRPEEDAGGEATGPATERRGRRWSDRLGGTQGARVWRRLGDLILALALAATAPLLFAVSGAGELLDALAHRAPAKAATKGTAAAGAQIGSVVAPPVEPAITAPTVEPIAPWAQQEPPRLLAEPGPLARVEEPAPESQEQRRRQAERNRTIVQLALGLMTLLAGLWTLVEVQRLRSLGDKARPGRDSPLFRAGLEACLPRLTPNPRQIVRFKNVARFLYHVVAERMAIESPPIPHGAWAPTFFTMLTLHSRLPGLWARVEAHDGQLDPPRIDWILGDRDQPPTPEVPLDPELLAEARRLARQLAPFAAAVADAGAATDEERRRALERLATSIDEWLRTSTL